MGNIYSTRKEQNSADAKYKVGKSVTPNKGCVTTQDNCKESANGQQNATTNSEDSSYGTMRVPSHNHGLTDGDKRSIITHFIYLRDHIPVDELRDKFVADGDLSAAGDEELQREAAMYARSNLFLRKLLRFRKRDAYVRFLEHLKNIGEDHIVKKLLQPDNVPGDRIIATLLPDDASEKLRGRQEYLYDEMEPDEVALHFLEQELITVDEYEVIIRSHSTRRERCVTLVNLIYIKLPSSYSVLLVSLQLTDQEHIIEEIVQHITDTRQTGNLATAPSSRLPKWLQKFKTVKRRRNRENIIYDKKGKPLFQYNMSVVIKHVRNEGQIVQALRDPGVIRSINRTLLMEQQCLLEDVWHGSIVLRLKLIVDPLLQRVETLLSGILKVVMGHQGVQKHLIDKDHATISCFAGNVDFLNSNMEYLQGSVSPVHLAKSFQRKGVLSESEVKTILYTAPINRRQRVKRLFGVVCDKKDESFDLAMSVLKEELPEVYQQIRPAVGSTRQTKSRHDKPMYCGNFCITKRHQRMTLPGSLGTKISVCPTYDTCDDHSFQSLDSGFFEISSVKEMQK